MAALFIDGFDKYGPTGITGTTLSSLLLQEWTSVAISNSSIAAGLSSTGNSLTQASSSTATVTKTLSSTYTRLIGGVRFSGTLGSAAGLTIFLSSGTFETAIRLNTDGTIALLRGGSLAIPTATLATSSASVLAGAAHYLEYDITFGPSGGIYQVWLDAVSIIGPTSSANVSASSTVNAVQLTGPVTYDDLYVFDTSGSTNKAVLNSNPRVETQFPTSSSQTQFAPETAVLGTSYSATASTNPPGANQLFLRKYTNSVTASLASVSCVPQATSAGAKFKAVAYADSAGAPNGAPLATGTEVVGTTSGSTLTSSFGSPPSLSASTPYWVGFITDTSVALQETDATTSGFSASNTYVSGAPTTPTMTSGKNSWNLWGNLTGYAVNWVSQNQNPSGALLSYVQDATPGDEDLYGFPALSTVPNSIYAVAVKCNAALSTSGVRTMDVRLNSGGTDSAGSNAGQTPATSFGWMDSFFETDPHTGLAWTATGVNAATSGPKVAS